MLQSSVRSQDRVVRLDDGGGDLWGRVDGELELGLLAVVDAQALHEQRREAGASAAAERVKDQEALETSALVGELANTVQDEVDDLLADGVVATGVVVRSVLFTGDELLRVEELSVGTGAPLVDHSRLQVDEDCAWHVLASARLREERVERVVAAADRLVRWHLTVRLDAVLQAVQLPAGVAHLNTSLTNVDWNTLSHFFSFSSSCVKLQNVVVYYENESLVFLSKNIKLSLYYYL